MKVSVAIVGFRNAEDIVRCLRALSASTYADFNVVVVENGGPEAYAALLAAAPGVLPGGQGVRLVFAAENGGFAGGVNRCIAEAPDADAWWILNPDTEPHPDAMARYVARLDAGGLRRSGRHTVPSGRAGSVARGTVASVGRQGCLHRPRDAIGCAP